MARNRKRCTSCGKTKHHSQFHKRGDTSDGLQTICKLCANGASARYVERKEDEAWNQERVVELLEDYNPGLQAKRLAKRLPKRMRVIPRMVTECRNPRAFSHNGEMVIYSYHEVERCPYCNHSNYLVRTGYERTNRATYLLEAASRLQPRQIRRSERAT